MVLGRRYNAIMRRTDVFLRLQRYNLGAVPVRLLRPHAQ
jgi:hypothetical protein